VKAYTGSEFHAHTDQRSWWDYLIVAVAVGIFVYLGVHAKVPPLSLNLRWAAILAVAMLATAISCGWGLWKASRFS
jgi:NhaP-type Na+/H+ or K+/H+ antiporter